MGNPDQTLISAPDAVNVTLHDGVCAQVRRYQNGEHRLQWNMEKHQMALAVDDEFLDCLPIPDTAEFFNQMISVVLGEMQSFATHTVLDSDPDFSWIKHSFAAEGEMFALTSHWKIYTGDIRPYQIVLPRVLWVEWFNDILLLDEDIWLAPGDMPLGWRNLSLPDAHGQDTLLTQLRARRR